MATNINRTVNVMIKLFINNYKRKWIKKRNNKNKNKKKKKNKNKNKNKKKKKKKKKSL
jgi:uncharacterized membrane protein